jgi:small-conductance mechanosensitive channel
MSLKMYSILRVLRPVIFTLIFLLSGPAFASAPLSPEARVAHLSDEQVRRMLIQELKRAAAETADPSAKRPREGLMAGSLDEMDDFASLGSRRIRTVFSRVGSLPAELTKGINQLTEGKGLFHLVLMIGVILLVFLGATIVEKLFEMRTKALQMRIDEAPVMKGMLRFISAVVKTLPNFLGIVIFGITSLVIWLIVFGAGAQPIRMLFVGALVVVLAARILALFSRILCSPAAPRLRIARMNDADAQRVHRIVAGLVWTAAVVFLISAVNRQIMTVSDYAILMDLVLGTGFIGFVGVLIWKNRSPVAAAIAGGVQAENEGQTWLRTQIASIWHVVATAYLCATWLVWAGRLVIYDPEFDGAFFISLLIVPIFFALDRLGQWIITAVLGTLGTARERKEAEDGSAEEPPSADRAAGFARPVTRGIIFFALCFWMLDVWGFGFPFGKAVFLAVGDIFITVALALIVWRMLNNYITRKLESSAPAEAEETDTDNEWGGGATMGRSHTLLPVLRKFIGIVMTIMVTLIVLSSMGINIGPLLAGAGVAGLAIGFGAQKIVADVLSGLFFLIDDAFRVGEYIKAGNVSGRIEALTLRNAMIRHHRGMLQIVPFSDLGSITNFMRGDMVVKFNIVLPYDTDVDKVRKVIKKVGKKMLEDPELGPDFVKPVKSQGIRSVGDSVLTFRIKFTAKPGQHFVIRREAYRRITEALEAQGIYYAHRKVIVEIPELARATQPGNGTNPATGLTPQQEEALIMAGASAGLDTIVEEEQKAGAEKKEG